MSTNQFLNNNQILESLQIVSEKILPEKIKKVVWNRKIDLIGINCGKYFEIHRIGFKHEEIFKKEENCEIKEILFFDDKYLNGNHIRNENCLVAVLLEDTTVYFINCSTCEIVLKTKNKIPGFFTNIHAECIHVNEHNKSENKEINPFNHEINFNSFSKIEVSYLNFLENYFDFENCFVYNKNNLQIDFYLKFLIQFAKIKLEKEIYYIRQMGKANGIFIMSYKSEKIIECNFINLNYLLNSKFFNSWSNNSFYLIYFSLHVLDYVTNILQIFSKIIYKLSIIFFDKYIFSNNLEHQLNDENEKYFKEKLNKELKNLMYFGKISEYLKNLLNNDLFEGKSILKFDENIHFNLKNIEEISVENIKPSLDILNHYLNQIKYNLKKFDFNEEEIFLFKKLENNFDTIFLRFEEFLCNICRLKIDYRNFLSWLNSFNTTATNSESNKNHLNSVIIDYDRLNHFVNGRNYDLIQQIDLIEAKNEPKYKYNLNERTKEIISESNISSDLLSDNIIANYIKDKKIEDLFNCLSFDKNDLTSSNNHNENSQRNGLKNRLNELKEQLKNLKEILTKKIEKEIPIENILTFDLNKYSVKAVKIFNQSDHSLLLIRIEDSLEIKEYLLLIRIFYPDNYKENFNKKFSYSIGIIKLKYENVSILDYEFHKENDLLFLVKTNVTESVDNTVNNSFKESIILTQIENYNFSDLCEDDIFKLNEINYDFHSEEIKIDKFIDVDCSDYSFITAGWRGLFGLVDNKKNKIVIIDI